MRSWSSAVTLSVVFFGMAAATVTAAPPLPAIPSMARNAAGFAPPGWRILDESAKGDLNGDGIPDLAVALGSKKEVTDNPASVIDTLPPRLLIVAWGVRDDSYRRAVVDSHLLLGRFEGGVFGDPFADLSIQRGVLTVEHYGGARDRWAITDRFRWQNGAFEQIGHTNTGMDTAALEYETSTDTNLSTGLVADFQKGRTADRDRASFHHTYYALRVPSLAAAPTIGAATLNQPPVRLRNRADVIRGASQWHGESDLSATISAAMVGDMLCLRVLVRDDRILTGDTVRLVDARGKVVPPTTVIRRPAPGGYLWQGLYPAKSLQLWRGSVRGIEDDNNPSLVWGMPKFGHGSVEPGLSVEPELSASVEVLDFDQPGKAHATLSTSRGGRTYPARLRFVPSPGLPRLGSGADFTLL